MDWSRYSVRDVAPEIWGAHSFLSMSSVETMSAPNSTFRRHLVSLYFMRFGYSLVFIAMVGSLSEVSRAQSVIEGRVKLPKTSSAPVVIKRYEIVTQGGIIATKPPLAVVYLEGSFPKRSSSAEKEMLQKDLNFVPPLLPVQTGTKVTFPNLDDTYHNIFSFSPAKRFDLGRYRPDERPIPSVIFDVPGLVTVRCDIHEHMRALIIVLDTPYFMTSDADGRFRLSGLPSGRYTLKAWLSSKTTLERPVELASGSTLHVDLP
jgi:plastocyanin